MDVDRRVAVLTDHAFLVVNVLVHGDVVFGVQGRLILAVFHIGRLVRAFHQTLKGNADPLSAVVAGGAGFRGNTAVLMAAHGNLRLASGLDRMDQTMPEWHFHLARKDLRRPSALWGLRGRTVIVKMRHACDAVA